MKRTPFIIPVIIISQFAGTSLWFAGNAILPDLQRQWGLIPESLGAITSSVQFGFIVGTLIFAFFAIADRYSPRIVFLVFSLLGATFNLGVYLVALDFDTLLVFRFLIGACLAGIYPVGMKIASGWYREGLGNALGFLVGALVLGTSFPHLLKGLGETFSWQDVTLAVSGISAAGGILMFVFVPDGPYLAQGTKFNLKTIPVIFRSEGFRDAAFGYFGHMWELYTLYAFVPVLLATYLAGNPSETLNISFWSFCIIGAGSIGCVAGGIISKKTGSARVAFTQLLFSALCCIFSPLLFGVSVEFFLLFLLFWGIVVVGDSPQYSALVGLNAPKEYVGSSLTIMNSIGFSITIVSIQFTTYLSNFVRPEFLLSFLVVGPILGIRFLWPLVRGSRESEVREGSNLELTIKT
ncbi:MAG: MFS transporter [Ignavibacteriales bacterium]|nr:MFS transporter [Ignavibacteriales bacterium]